MLLNSLIFFSRTSAEIQVREPRVHVIEPLCDVTVMEDETVMLECTLSYPEADVTWFKDNNKILASESLTVEKVLVLVYYLRSPKLKA